RSTPSPTPREAASSPSSRPSSCGGSELNRTRGRVKRGAATECARAHHQTPRLRRRITTSAGELARLRHPSGRVRRRAGAGDAGAFTPTPEGRENLPAWWTRIVEWGSGGE